MRGVVQGILASIAVGALLAEATHAAPAPGACSVLTRAEVRQFSGNTQIFDLLAPQEDKLRTGSSCTYGDIIVQIDPFPFATIDAERTKAGANFEAVPGIGDVAYARENTRAEAAEIYFRVGQRVVTIQMDILTGATYNSVKPRLIGLSRALAAKLR